MTDGILFPSDSNENNYKVSNCMTKWKCEVPEHQNQHITRTDYFVLAVRCRRSVA